MQTYLYLNNTLLV